MNEFVPVSDFLSRGIGIEPDEAVALVLELISDLRIRGDAEPGSAADSLTVDSILLGPDGTVRCDRGAAAPAVSDVGRLLDTIIRAGAPKRVSGALRFTIARAVLEVDVPPFASLEELAGSLKRFERGQRMQVLVALYARGTGSEPKTRPGSRASSRAPIAAAAVQSERRRTTPSETQLRRQLRKADLELYEKLVAQKFVDTATEPLPAAAFPEQPVARIRAVRVPRPVTAAIAVLALGASFLGGYGLYMRNRTQPAIESSAAGTGASVSATSESSPSLRSLPSSSSEGSTSALRREPATVALLDDRGADVALTRGVPAPAFSPSFSADGAALLFHTGRSVDSRSALMSGQMTPVGSPVAPILDDGARNYHVQPSPDGTRIAFDSDRDGERGVYIADRNGANPGRVSGRGYAAVPSWAPDGGRLTFVRAEEGNRRVWNLWLLSLGSGEIRRLTGFRYGQTWSASWFPDGRRIAYSHEDRLVVLDVDSAASREYPTPMAGRLVRTPAVSPDGSQAIFQVSGSGAWLLEFQTGSMRRVLGDRSAEEFAWSPDGRRVAFHSRRGGDWGIWIMAL
jgi:Tol biopolymer transport system component